MGAGRLPSGVGTRGRVALCTLVVAAMTAGCTGLTDPGGWFGKGEPQASSRGPLPYYTSQPGMRLYTEPSFTSAHIAVLPLHQMVYRSRVDRGFAYVEVEGSGQRGWVDNARLIWRLPTAATGKAGPDAGSARGGPAPVESTAKPVSATPVSATEDATAPQPASTSDGPAATPAAAQQTSSDTAQPEDPTTADPSAFSPF